MLVKKAAKPIIENILIAALMALIVVGLAAPAGAAGPKHPTPQGFLAAARAAGIIGADPAILEDGYNVCWELWDRHSPAPQVAAGLQKDYPTLTTDQAAHFVTAAYQGLCPVAGSYDWWAYSTG